MRTENLQKEIPEIARYTRYYEYDGMLRAYANRAMFLAILFGVIAFASINFNSSNQYTQLQAGGLGDTFNIQTSNNDPLALTGGAGNDMIVWCRALDSSSAA